MVGSPSMYLMTSDMAPASKPEVIDFLASDHEVCPDSVYGEEPSGVIVCAVEDVARVLLIWDGIHRFRIVQSRDVIRKSVSGP